MLLATRRHTLTWPDLADLSWFPFLEPVIRLEEYQKDDKFVVRAELPGVDPTKDVEVTAEEGVLRLSLVRLEPTEYTQEGRSEFRYGSFHRTITLPPGTKEESISAKYSDGILEITMNIGEPIHTSKSIPIAIGNGQPKPVKKA
jgi:HSP20 family molecular chaperone IbpA